MDKKPCALCDQEVDVFETSPASDPELLSTTYKCERCGSYRIDSPITKAQLDVELTPEKKEIISIVVRNEYEKERNKQKPIFLLREKIDQIIKQYRPLDPLDKMDHALSQLYKSSSYVGQDVMIELATDYPLYHCSNFKELGEVLKLLSNEKLIETRVKTIGNHYYLSITTKGYQRLRTIANPGGDSRYGFVAMWFNPETQKVYEKAIKPAIEYKEDGEDSSRFEAIKVDDVEHINDINDEIIAQIRRSRFMVCDLTGYRGGVYFEAGFAYGLGLEVIYTCREDWADNDDLHDENGKKVNTLFDSNKKPIDIKKEGVHFDLAHRNRIQWSPDKLPEFKTALENRIKAVIY